MDNAHNDPAAQNSGAVTLPQNYQPNVEELRLLAQCRAESNFKGSISAVLAGGLTYQAIKFFNIKVNPKWGPYPKVGSACLFGFFLGKLMAIPTCYEKFKSLPNSPLGAYMRQRRGDLGESLPLESAVDPNLSFPISAPSKYSADGQMNSAIDIDVYSSPSNMDSYTGNELNGPTADNLPDQSYPDKPSVSYAELRQRNRSEYARTDKERYVASTLSDTPATPTRRSSPSIPVEEKNKYGDVWG